MSFRPRAVALALIATMAAPASALAFGGGAGGCSDLPEYDRAQGALEGMTSACDMSVEQARRIIAAQGGQTYQQPAPAPVPHRLYRRHRLRQPQ